MRLLQLIMSHFVVLMTFSLTMATTEGHAAEQSLTSNCMSSLLQSYGIPANRSDIYAQRMADRKFDELTLRMHSELSLLLRLHLQTFGITGSDFAKVTACAHKGTGAKSSLCAQTPCGVGGTCMFSQTNRGKYVCDCKPGFTGTFCENDLCLPTPCHHNATCYHTTGGFLCDCPEGYTGKTCEIAVNECQSSPCQNGGSCEGGFLQYTCKCPFGFDGVNCEQMWFNQSGYQQLVQTVMLQDSEIRRQLAEIETLKSEGKTLNLAINKTQHELSSFQAELEEQGNDVCKAVHGVINWQQKSGRFETGADDGQLVSMTYQKKKSDTHLRLTWSSNMRQWLHNRCSQWYFTIDGRECTKPAPINGNLYQDIGSGHGNNDHRHSTIIGVCRGTGAGDILSGSHQIAMNIRSNCNGHHGGGEGYTGWQSTTTMIVEELCAPQ